MDLAWVAPPAVLLVGAAAGVALCRRLVDAVDAAQSAQRRLRRLEDALIPVRAESRRLGATVERLDHR